MQRTTGPFPRTSLLVLTVLVAVVAAGAVTPAAAQEPITDFKPLPVQTRQFGDLAEGPYNRLVIQNRQRAAGSRRSVCRHLRHSDRG